MNKYTCLFSLCILSLLSCEHDSNINKGSNYDYKLDKILNYFPLETFENKSKVIFLNQSGEEKTLDLVLEKLTDHKTIQEKIYSIETILVTYSDPFDSNYRLKITLSTSVNSPSNIVEFLQAAIYTTLNGGYSPNIKIGNEGEAIICIFENEKDLLNKHFINVYTNFKINDPNFLSFTEIYYTPNMGIVGFKGDNNELWVLKDFL